LLILILKSRCRNRSWRDNYERILWNCM
jgi:hypothetical protein